MVTSSEVLDIIEIVYYVPALPVAAYVCFKHGFSREAGWLTLVILSLVRIIGAATGIAAVTDPSTGLITTSLVMSSIGSATLVAALTGVVNRIENGSRQSHLPARTRKLLQLVSIAAIALGAVGASKMSSSNASDRSSGETYMRVAAILILVQFLATVLILAFSAFNMRAIMDGDRKLFALAAAACPFILVRVIYSICSAFNYNSSTFSLRSTTITAIIVRAVMAIAMEIIATTLLIVGGVVSPKIAQGERVQNDVHMEQYRSKDYRLAENSQYQPSYQQPYQQAHQQPYGQQGRY